MAQQRPERHHFGNTIPVFNKHGVKKVYINPILEENQASLSLFKYL